MSNKSRLYNAKLKISQMKDKYSKPCDLINNGIDSLSSNSHSGNVDPHNVEIPKGIIKDYNNGNEVEQLEELFRLNIKSGLQLCSSDTEGFKISSPPSSNDLPVLSASKLSPGRSIGLLSDLSEPLERICFLSSSSNDQTESVQVIGHKNQMSSLNSISRIHESSSSSPPKGGSVGKLELVHCDHSPPKVQSISKSEKSTVGHSSSMSNVTEKISSTNSYESDETGRSGPNVIRNLDFRISDESPVNVAHSLDYLETEELCSKAELDLDPKPCSSTNNTISKPVKKVLNQPKTDITGSPESISNIKDSKRRRRPASKLAEENNISSSDCPITENKNSYIAGRRSRLLKCHTTEEQKNYKSHHTHYKITQMLLKPNKMRPMLKSCSLIRNVETNREEFEALLQKAKVVLRVEDFSSNKSAQGHSCNELIKRLLTHQIQLIRYFIESHHQMYLNCCQAVKLLSQTYQQQATCVSPTGSKHQL